LQKDKVAEKPTQFAASEHHQKRRHQTRHHYFSIFTHHEEIEPLAESPTSSPSAHPYSTHLPAMNGGQPNLAGPSSSTVAICKGRQLGQLSNLAILRIVGI
jgi:hypothetical protein